jgi:hypothetical protein
MIRQFFFCKRVLAARFARLTQTKDRQKSSFCWRPASRKGVSTCGAKRQSLVPARLNNVSRSSLAGFNWANLSVERSGRFKCLGYCISFKALMSISSSGRLLMSSTWANLIIPSLSTIIMALSAVPSVLSTPYSSATAP